MSAGFSESSARHAPSPELDRIGRSRSGLGSVVAMAATSIVALAGGCVTTPEPTMDEPASAGALSEISSARLVVELETPDWADEQVYVALFQNRDGWLETDGWLVGRTVQVTPPLTVVVFDDVPARPTAVSAFVDLDRDEDFTRNGFGIPVEPWGFSNDLSVLFGRPSFRSASVEVAAPLSTIRFAVGRGLDRSAIRRARREATEERESS